MRMRIMAVDDNTVNLATIEQELKDKYEVVPMLTGRRAIKYLYRENVDLILLDVQMPIMDGIDTLKEIRTLENGVTIPVIFLTSRKDAATVIAGSELGIMDYITKPFDPADLKNRIEQVFKRLGVLPMDEREIYATVSDISNYIHQGNIKPAVAKMDEMLGYQIDEDISGRMRVAKKKLELGEIDSARNAVDRILTLLNKEGGANANAIYPPISASEISAKLLYAMDDIANFKLGDCADKLNSLLNYDLPDRVRRGTAAALVKAKEYDEEEALILIREMLDFLNSEMAKQPNESLTPHDEGNGFHLKYFSKNK